MRSKQQLRFDLYKPMGSLADPESTGVLPSDAEFDLATPNLTRNENVHLVASSLALEEALEVNLKWRPSSQDPGLVTLQSSLRFIVGSQLFEPLEALETYRAQFSSQRPGRILQYGSKGSKLRLTINCPYRRMRLTFSGQVRESQSNRLVHLKLNLVINVTAKLFDFLEQFNETMANDTQARALISHNRHEQMVKINGEFHIDGVKKPLSWRGFYSRQFVEIESASHLNGGRGKRRFKRILSFMENGQSFHVGNVATVQDQLSQGNSFGYTSFEIQPLTVPIDKPVELDWSTVQRDTKTLELKVSGQRKTLDCVGQLREPSIPQWFSVTTNGVKGWAWLSLEDSDVDLLESDDEMKPFEKSRSDYKLAVQSGRLAGDLAGDGTWNHQPAPLIVNLDDPACKSSELVGSKAASLAMLMSFRSSCDESEANLEVASGFVLTREAHQLIMTTNEGLAQAVVELQNFVGEVGSQSVTENQELNSELAQRCESLRKSLMGAKLPDQLKDQLSAHLRKLTSEHQGDPSSLSFAVRSSSWGEDEDDMSAAGQLTTLLNIGANEDEIARACVECFASKFSLENVQYKRQHGLPLDLPMAVVVQRMISCEKAGVMFTCLPTTGDDSRLLVTANFGLGESVVSGQADPDSIVVRLEPESGGRLTIDKIDIGQKNVIISHDGRLNDQDKTKCCLNEDEILRLANLGIRVRDFFAGQQMDIEWGYHDNRVYLFQSRPVTGLESSTFSQEELLHEYERASKAERFFYTRANIGEVMPYAATPFTLSSFIFSWTVIGNRMYIRLDSNYDYSPHCTNEVFYEKYHSFFNVNSGALLSLTYDGEKPLIAKAMEISLFGHEMEARPDIREAARGFSAPENLFQGRKFDLISWPLRWAPKFVTLRERATNVRLRTEIRSLKNARGYQQNKLLGLYNQMNSIWDGLYKAWENHIFMVMFNGANNLGLSAVLSKYIKDPMQLSAATNMFLAITPNVISAEIPVRIDRMAKLILARGLENVERFLSMPSDEALKTFINEANANDDLKREFDEFIKKFGHRTYNEFELANKPWREEPQNIVDMIKTNCRQTKSAESDNGQDPAEKKKRPETVDQVFDSLGLTDRLTMKDRLVLKYMLIPKCQQMLSTRELTKDVLVEFGDVMREATRMLALEMQRQMRLPDADLFYYLMYDEVKPLIETHQPSIVIQALKRRQLFKAIFQEPWKYEEIITDLTPMHMRPSKELDEAIASAPRLMGTPASSGKVRGRVCLIQSFKQLHMVKSRSVLVTHSTDIAFSPVFPLISGIITEVGGLISHGAVVAREYGLPSVIGIPDVTRILEDGEEIILDADNGVIIRLDKPQPTQVNGLQNQ